MFSTRIKQLFKLSNLVNGLFFIGLLILVFSPSAKATVIKGLMKAGLFQPHISKPTLAENIQTDLPDLVFQNTNGQLIHLANQKGKVIFINFWATWCGPCIAEMPGINSLYEKMKGNKNMMFIIVDADHDFTKSKPFMAKHHFSMPLYQAVSKIPQNFLSDAIPATTIIDRSGKVVFHQDGSVDYSNPKVLAYLNSISK